LVCECEITVLQQHPRHHFRKKKAPTTLGEIGDTSHGIACALSWTPRLPSNYIEGNQPAFVEHAQANSDHIGT